jgi:hypothetical protein
MVDLTEIQRISPSLGLMIRYCNGVITHIACDGLAEFFLGRFAVIGMDALNPILVGFVHRIRGQPVNQQIFRRPAIAEASPQVDLETADPPDLLHPRELGLAFP